MVTIARRSAQLSAPLLAAMLGATALSAAPEAVAPPAAAVTPRPEAAAEALNVVEVVTRAAPAVVSVEAVRAKDGEGLRPAGAADIEEFARRLGMPLPKAMTGAAPYARVQATGAIVSPDGQIVTGLDTVEGAAAIRVRLADGRALEARVLGQDAFTGLALLKVEASGLPTLAFAGADEVHVGEPVVALGVTPGLSHAVSAGVISTIDDTASEGPAHGLLRTDAAIGRGNAGGLLLDGAGRIVGIDARHVTPGGADAGFNVAVPSDVAASVVAALATDGQMPRGYLGVQISPVGPDVAAALGLDDEIGAFVNAVGDGTPAQTAGLQRGDIVLSVDGADIRTPRDLTRSIAGDAPGTRLKVQFLRAGQPMSVAVTLGNRADHQA